MPVPSRLRAALHLACLILLAGLPAANAGDMHASTQGWVGSPEAGRRPGGSPSVYVSVQVTGAADTAAVVAVLAELGGAGTKFGGEVVAGSDPTGVAAGPDTSAGAILAFPSRDQARAWTNSDQFRQVREKIGSSASVAIMVLPARPMSQGGMRSRMIYDQKAFEPFVKKTDDLLSRTKGICGNC